MHVPDGFFNAAGVRGRRRRPDRRNGSPRLQSPRLGGEDRTAGTVVPSLLTPPGHHRDIREQAVSQPDNRTVSERTTTPAPVAKPAASPGAASPAVSAVRPAGPPPAPPAAKPAGPSRTPAEIEREIEATRARLASSIDELADRVSPKNVAKRSADKAKLTVIDEGGDPRVGRLAAIGSAVVAVLGLVVWRRRS